MYRCSNCAHEMAQPQDRCPSCHVLLSGVRCDGCKYEGAKQEFIDHGHRCPKCGSTVSIPSASSGGGAPGAAGATPPAHPAEVALRQPTGAAALVKSCAECLNLTATRQAGSLRAAASWMLNWQSRDGETAPEPEGEMTVVRAEPDCDACEVITPFHRDFDDDTVGGALQATVSSFTLHDLRVEASLATQALVWLMPSLILENGPGGRVGPVSRHALIAANNLLCGAQPGDPAPGAAATSAADAARHALKCIGEILHPGAPSEAWWSADIVLVHGLRQVAEEILAYRGAQPQAAPPASAPAAAPAGIRPAVLWCLAGLTLLLAGVAAAGLPMAAIPAAGCFVGLLTCLLRNLAAKPLSKPAASAAAPPRWSTVLQQAWQRDGQGLQDVRTAWQRVDWLLAAEMGFGGDWAGRESEIAAMLKALHAKPGGPALCAWMARRAAQALAASLQESGWDEPAARFRRLGMCLLDEDPDARGTEIAGWMLTELDRAMPPSSQAENGVYWAFLASHMPSGAEAGNWDGLPELLAAWSHCVAVLEHRADAGAEPAADKAWYGRVRRIVRLGEPLVDRLCGRQPMLDPHWHLLLVRWLAAAWRQDRGRRIFPAWSRFTSDDLYARVAATQQAFTRTDGNGAPTGEAAVVDPLREAVMREARAILLLAGWVPLCLREAAPPARAPVAVPAPATRESRWASPLDALFRLLLAGAPVGAAPAAAVAAVQDGGPAQAGVAAVRRSRRLATSGASTAGPRAQRKRGGRWS